MNYGWYSSETGRGGPTSETESDVGVCQASMGSCIVSSVASVYGDMLGDGPEEA
jgi:hypothetical protein